MREEYLCRTPEEMENLGRQFGEKAKKGTVISLRGSLGAGKTVFARGLSRALGITESIVSPTFTLIQEYDGTLKMYHMDLYRLSCEEDFIALGGEDFLYSDGICLIEWSEVIDEMLPKGTIYVNIKINEDQSRTVEVTDERSRS
ncbi:MAG: tRNA (adenosine(37)-N6)-threonylcarbamoyltransferase complex ATPase subunit type 1 TsaE [Sphaerochaetaceae bacterium]|nr:tRNA (adenosine(37)-N6)-threonylcarbamoyltransferase complex ATPase subunit type 1 TsaE [Sphaerochaetaceae bacterium]